MRPLIYKNSMIHFF